MKTPQFHLGERRKQSQVGREEGNMEEGREGTWRESGQDRWGLGEEGNLIWYWLREEY